MNQNSEIVGLQLSYDLQEKIPIALKNSEGPPDEFTLNYVKEMYCYFHFGFAVPRDRFQLLKSAAIDWVVAYFQSNKVNELNGGWYTPLSRGMLLCLLAKRNSELRSICQWATPKKKLEYKGPLPDEVQHLYLILASQFQPAVKKGFLTLLDKIQKSRKREVKLLVAALTAVVERDQKAFEISISKCVEFHSKKPKPAQDAYFMEDWLPLHANTIYLCGLELGLEDPNYDQQIMAYLMTPASVGFENG